MGKAGSSTNDRMLLYGHPDSRPLLEAMKKPRVARIPRSGAAMIKQAEKTYAPLEVERQVQEFWERAKPGRKARISSSATARHTRPDRFTSDRS